MSSRTKTAAFYLLAVLMGGCVPVVSLHPLYSEDKQEVVFEGELLGKWAEMEDPNNTWEFRKVSDVEKGYELAVCTEDGSKGLFKAHLVELADEMFLDVFPKELPCGDVEQCELKLNVFFLVPAHSFVRVRTAEGRLEVQLTVADKMEELLEEEPGAVEYEKVENVPVLTGSVAELQEFVLEHCRDDSLFGEARVLVRQKRAEQQEGPAAE